MALEIVSEKNFRGFRVRFKENLYDCIHLNLSRQRIILDANGGGASQMMIGVRPRTSDFGNALLNTIVLFQKSLERKVPPTPNF